MTSSEHEKPVNRTRPLQESERFVICDTPAHSLRREKKQIDIPDLQLCSDRARNVRHVLRFRQNKRLVSGGH